jgi:hypothetical protein
MEAEHLERLRSRADQARLDFMGAKLIAETFDEHFGSLTYVGPYEKESVLLWQRVKLAYIAYRTAWIDLQACLHSAPRPRTYQSKSTAAFGSPVPNHIALAKFEKRVRHRLKEKE